MKPRMSLPLFLTLAAVALIVPPLMVFADGQEVCGGIHQDPPLEDLGPGSYCVKGGSSNSEGCNGYLDHGSFEEVSGTVDAEGACGLSHWSFVPGPADTNTPVPHPTYTSVPTETSVPTATPLPTETSTPDPEVTPTVTPTGEPEEPTPTEPAPTPSDPDPDPEPKMLPNTGSPLEWNPQLWNEPGFPDNVVFTHNGNGGIGEKLVQLRRGHVLYAGMGRYDVLGYIQLLPEDVDTVLGLAEHHMLFVTCTVYNVSTGEWRYRLVVIVNELGPDDA